MPPPAAAATAAPAQAAAQGPGMIAQMAATAGSVAVGSTIGHGLSSMLFGGRSDAAAAAPEAASPAVQQQINAACDFQIKGACRRSFGTNADVDRAGRVHEVP